MYVFVFSYSVVPVAFHLRKNVVAKVVGLWVNFDVATTRVAVLDNAYLCGYTL